MNQLGWVKSLYWLESRKFRFDEPWGNGKYLCTLAIMCIWLLALWRPDKGYNDNTAAIDFGLKHSHYYLTYRFSTKDLQAIGFIKQYFSYTCFSKHDFFLCSTGYEKNSVMYWLSICASYWRPKCVVELARVMSKEIRRKLSKMTWKSVWFYRFHWCLFSLWFEGIVRISNIKTIFTRKLLNRSHF